MTRGAAGAPARSDRTAQSLLQVFAAYRRDSALYGIGHRLDPSVSTSSNRWLFRSARLGRADADASTACVSTSAWCARAAIDRFTETIPQLTLTRFIDGGHFGAHVRAMRGVYAGRMELLASTLRRQLGGIVEPQLATGGLQMRCLLSESHREQETVEAVFRPAKVTPLSG